MLDDTRPAPVAGEAVPTPLRHHIVDFALDRTDEATAARYASFLRGDTASLIEWFGAEIDRLHDRGDGAARLTLDRDIAAIDALICEQLEAILHHRDFQRMEASWRGVEYLLDAANSDERVQVRLLSVRWDELSRDFERAADFDQSELFAKVYNEEYGMPGGLPYGLLVCDFAVRHRRPAGTQSRSDDISTLNGLAQVAAGSFSPCVIGAAPELFGVDKFSELSYAQDFHNVFRSPEYQRWRNLQQREDSRFLGIILPRVLLRDAWPDTGTRTDRFCFREGRRGLDSDDWLWGNGVYAFAAVVVRAFRDWGWFADIRGTNIDVEDAGLIAGFPAPAFSTDEVSAFRRPLEVEITDSKQKALDSLGFITLSPCRLTPFMAFLGTQSAHVQEEGSDLAENANARLSSMLQYILCVSRFAHYVKVMTRDRIGAYTTAEELERILGDWLRQYVLGNDDASLEMKARFPLNGGSVEVRDIPGRSGSYVCTMHLMPHFQIDQVVTGFRLQTEVHGLRTG